jgi:hypothetical protein
MKKILAIARLDFRRLGFGLLAVGLITGLLPPFASGLGVILVPDAVLLMVLALVGLVSGVRFGTDFMEGRGSFYFARPLPSWVLFAARFAAMLALGVMAYVALMASNWLATSDRTDWEPWRVSRFHVEGLVACWAVSFFCGVAVSAHSPSRPDERFLPAWILIPMRLVVGLGSATVIFGLFADLVMRAYRGPHPGRLFFGSWIAALFIAGGAAVILGRTERLRMTKVLSAVLFAHLALSSLVLGGIWAYVLRPGPGAIESVRRAEASPDGRSAFLLAQVDRGDPNQFFPSFLLDMRTEKAQGFPSEPFHGPWWSRDGNVMVWNQSSVVFLSQVFNLMRGSATFRYRVGDGPVENVPMPSPTKSRVANRLDVFHWQVTRVIPASDGDLFVIQTKKGYAFVSKSRGTLSEFVLDAASMTPVEAILLPTNQLRVAMLRKEGSGGTSLEFADIDPVTSNAAILKSLPATAHIQVEFDRGSDRALVSVGPGIHRDLLQLVDLTKDGAAKSPVTLLSKAIVPDAMFLSDGRVVATERTVGQFFLRVFSPEGAGLLNIPLPAGFGRLGTEMFPGVVASNTVTLDGWDLALVEIGTGTVLRQLPGFSSPIEIRWVKRAPIPGTPGARLMRSKDGALYELSSPTTEPRLLLPHT